MSHGAAGHGAEASGHGGGAARTLEVGGGDSWATKYNPFGSAKYSKLEQVDDRTYNSPKSFHSDHKCTDVLCVPIFAICLGLLIYVFNYAMTNGDPRKIYHGMDFESNLCGVDLPEKPYVFWCKNTTSGAAGDSTNTSEISLSIDLDLQHPICLESCPTSDASESMCYDGDTGNMHLVADYATHAVGERYCLPQANALMTQYNAKMGGHPINDYVEKAVANTREGWRVLLAVLWLAVFLSMTFLLVVEFCAGVVVWLSILFMIAIPAACGVYLFTAYKNNGVDGMPGSGDQKTDLTISIVCFCVAGLFLCMTMCMSKAIQKATKVVEAAAECLFHCRSLLIEPWINLAIRATYWALMIVGIMHLIGVGEVRKSKIYRTFHYTVEEKFYIGFYLVMWIWGNDFITACSQYSIANASSRWYFTENKKNAPSCLLCRGYSMILFHIGSLAFGSFVIAFTRPLRYVLLVIVYGSEATDNATCGCISKVCGCCMFCFQSMLEHVCKNAFIDMAITSKTFCEAGTHAATLLHKNNKHGGAEFAALAGATWLFTFAGIGSVTATGCVITEYTLTNVEMFTVPTHAHYVQDPMILTCVAGMICFTVSLCFMLVFDSIADSLMLCMAMDYEELCKNPIPGALPKQKTPPQTMFQSMFFSQNGEGKGEGKSFTRPSFHTGKQQGLLENIKMSGGGGH